MKRATHRSVIAVAAILIAFATILGAFGAHALKGELSASQLSTYELAVRYLMFHALGLLGMGLYMRNAESAVVKWAAYGVLLGIVLFCGSLFALVAGAPRTIGFVTPLGGVALICGWIAFAVGVLRER